MVKYASELGLLEVASKVSRACCSSFFVHIIALSVASNSKQSALDPFKWITTMDRSYRYLERSGKQIEKDIIVEKTIYVSQVKNDVVHFRVIIKNTK